MVSKKKHIQYDTHSNRDGSDQWIGCMKLEQISTMSVNGQICKGIYHDQIKDALRKVLVKGTCKWRACMKVLMQVHEVKYVCQDLQVWRQNFSYD